MGGRPMKDGKDGVQVGITNTSNLPVEAIELEYPLLVEEYSLIPDSGGAGTHRGGLGLRRVVRPLAPELPVQRRRRAFPPPALGPVRRDAGGVRAVPDRRARRAPAGGSTTSRARSSSRRSRRWWSRPRVRAATARRRSAAPRTSPRIAPAASSHPSSCGATTASELTLRPAATRQERLGAAGARAISAISAAWFERSPTGSPSTTRSLGRKSRRMASGLRPIGAGEQQEVDPLLARADASRPRARAAWCRCRSRGRPGGSRARGRRSGGAPPPRSAPAIRWLYSEAGIGAVERAAPEVEVAHHQDRALPRWRCGGRRPRAPRSGGGGPRVLLARLQMGREDVRASVAPGPRASRACSTPLAASPSSPAAAAKVSAWRATTGRREASASSSSTSGSQPASSGICGPLKSSNMRPDGSRDGLPQPRPSRLELRRAARRAGGR